MRSADYVEMTTTSIASSGAGAVTCTQISNVPTFSIVFGAGACIVRYCIEDTVNKTFETGIGSVASNVLTRTKPQITWDGTTLDDSAPTALTFAGGGSPTSGDIKIRIAPTAENLMASLPARQTTIAGDSNWRDYPISAASQFAMSGRLYTLTADREYYSPYYLNSAGSLSGIQFEVMSAIASSNMKLALYSCGSDGLPGAIINTFNPLATATTGIKTDTTSGTWTPGGLIWLTPGWYYVGIIPSHAIAIRGSDADGRVNQTMTNPLGKKDAYGYGPFVYVAGSYTTGLPSTPALGSGTMMSNGTVGLLWLGMKVVS